MKITKYEHACLDIEVDGKRLIIDPGVFTTSLTNFENICGVVVTHSHEDHLNLELIDKILSANPDAPVLTVADTAEQLADRKHEVIHANTSELCSTFHLAFYGEKHTPIHEAYPVVDNTGVMVNDTLYYPGDSFTLPHTPIKILATPLGAPWLKVGEAMDFITACKPEQAFPTHDSVLSENGQAFHNNWLAQAAEKVGAKYTVLKIGDALEV